MHCYLFRGISATNNRIQFCLIQFNPIGEKKKSKTMGKNLAIPNKHSKWWLVNYSPILSYGCLGSFCDLEDVIGSQFASFGNFRETSEIDTENKLDTAEWIIPAMETDVVIVQKSPSFREQKVSAELRSLKLFIQIYLQKSLTLISKEKKLL